MVTGSTPVDDGDETLDGEFSHADEFQGALASDPEEERLMRSVLEHDDETVKDGELVVEGINQGVGTFTPDLLFDNLVSDYRNAERLYGETLLRALTGYSPDYLRKNIPIPEFQNALKDRIEERIEDLQDKEILDEQCCVTKQGEKLAALVLYTEELDALETKGLGKKERKERHQYGEKDETVP